MLLSGRRPRFESRCRRVLWRFLSPLSTLKTAYFSWLAWPGEKRWRCRLTDKAEWYIKESLRTTCSLSAATFSVPISKIYHYTLYARRAWWCTWWLWRATVDRKVPGSAAAVWLCLLAQGTSPVCCDLLTMSEWVPWWTVIAWMCVWIVSSAVWQQGLCMLPKELSWFTETNKSHIPCREKLMWSAFDGFRPKRALY